MQKNNWNELIADLEKDVFPVLSLPVRLVEWRSLRTPGSLDIIFTRVPKKIEAHIDHSTFHLCGGNECHWCSSIKRKAASIHVGLCVIAGKKPRIEVILLDSLCLLNVIRLAEGREIEDVVFRVTTSVGDKILALTKSRFSYEVEDIGDGGDYRTPEMEKLIIGNTSPSLLNNRKLKSIDEVILLMESQGVAGDVAGVTGVAEDVAGVAEDAP